MGDITFQDYPQPASPGNTAESSVILAGVRLVGIIVSSCALLLGFLVSVTCTKRSKKFSVATRWTQKWAKTLCAIAGIKIKTHGNLPSQGTLVLPNHSGYLDVLAVGSTIPCFFVGKAEVASWPGIGILFRATRHIGVMRGNHRTLSEVVNEVKKRLTNGHTVCIFAEGTSTGNNCVLSFKPSFLESAILAQAPVVPVGIRWGSSQAGVVVSEDIAYWKDHLFTSHAWRLLGLRGTCAEIYWGAPLAPENASRRSLAERAQNEVIKLTGLPLKSER